jgi:hypothetical protein
LCSILLISLLLEFWELMVNRVAVYQMHSGCPFISYKYKYIFFIKYDMFRHHLWSIMFPFRTWPNIPSWIQLLELWIYKDRILVNHFLKQSTNHHVWWSFKLTKDSTTSCNKNAKNYSAESWRDISFSEEKLGKCFALVCIENNFVLFTGFARLQRLSILWQYLKPFPRARLNHCPDDGSSRDLWNAGKLLPDYTAL